jgi:hypothetical protein
MCENVAAHAWSPPHFPDSEMTESAPIGARPLQNHLATRRTHWKLNQARNHQKELAQRKS